MKTTLYITLSCLALAASARAATMDWTYDITLWDGTLIRGGFAGDPDPDGDGTWNEMINNVNPYQKLVYIKRPGVKTYVTSFDFENTTAFVPSNGSTAGLKFDFVYDGPETPDGNKLDDGLSANGAIFSFLIFPNKTPVFGGGFGTWALSLGDPEPLPVPEGVPAGMAALALGGLVGAHRFRRW